MVLDYDGASGTLEHWYAYGQGPNEMLNRMDPAAGTRETLIPDVQGSIIGLLESGTGGLTKISYEPFGEHPGRGPARGLWTGPARENQVDFCRVTPNAAPISLWATDSDLPGCLMSERVIV